MQTNQDVNYDFLNEVIARYLGFTQKSYTPDSEKMWCDPKHGLPVGKLQFHSDWNWLIPALKKISQKDIKRVLLLLCQNMNMIFLKYGKL